MACFGGAGKRLATAADGRVAAAFLHEAGLGGADQRLAVFVDGLTRAGWRGERRARGTQCDEER